MVGVVFVCFAWGLLRGKLRLRRFAVSADVSPIAAVFEHCQILGWIPFFQSAAAATSFEPELLLAVGYRESRLDPKYLKVVGDNGHGNGLMQVDSRSYPDCVNAGH